MGIVQFVYRLFFVLMYKHMPKWRALGDWPNNIYMLSLMALSVASCSLIIEQIPKVE